MKTDTPVLSLIFRICPIMIVLLFFDNVDKDVNNFQIAKVQPQGVA